MKSILILGLLFSALSANAFDASSPSDRIQSNDPRIIELAETLTAGKKTNLEKSRAIHKYITSTITYDQPTRIAIESGQAAPYIQDALTVLRTKMAVCEGFSNLAAALHRAIGIPSKISIGKHYYFAYRLFPTLKKINRIPDVRQAQGLHGWNEVQIDGKWIPMDTTSDAGSSSGGAWTREMKEEYFNPDPEYFKATHLKEGEMDQ